MDAELLKLQRQFEFAQQAKSSIRLSDRNVVELVQKLQQLQIIDFHLLHTVSGKEYITPGKLEDAAYKDLSDYHAATVTLLALLSAAPDDESLMPNLKELVIWPLLNPNSDLIRGSDHHTKEMLHWSFISAKLLDYTKHTEKQKLDGLGLY